MALESDLPTRFAQLVLETVARGNVHVTVHFPIVT